MRVVEYDINNIDLKGYRGKTNWLKVIDNFVESDMACVRIEEYINKSPESCVSAINKSIKRYRKNGIKAIIRNGEVYLVKTR